MNLSSKDFSKYYKEKNPIKFKENTYDFSEQYHEDFNKFLDTDVQDVFLKEEAKQAWSTLQMLEDKDILPVTDFYFDILRRLSWLYPLAPITEDDFINYPNASLFAHSDNGPDGKKVVSALSTQKHSSLTRYVLEDNSCVFVEYLHVDTLDVNSGERIPPFWCGDFGDVLISTLYPISLPFKVPTSNYKVYMEVRGNKFFVDSIITPEVKLVKINKYFEYYYPDIFIKEISKEEFDKEPVEIHEKKSHSAEE